MELPPTPPEIGEGIYEFKHVDPVNDLDLLHAITLNPHNINAAWLERLDQVIIDASTHIDASATPTLSHVTFVRAKRREFRSMIGFSHPAHILSDTYARAEKRQNRELVPDRLYETLRTLYSMFEDPVPLIDKCPSLLGKNQTSLIEHFNFISRIVKATGWRGDVHNLVREEPSLLLYSRLKIGAVARLAVEYGSAEDLDMPVTRVANLVHPTPIEIQILAKMLRRDYKLGMTHQHGGKVKDLREIIHTAVDDPRTLENIGVRVLRSYFRYRPPDSEAQQRHPAIRQFIPPRNNLFKEEKGTEASSDNIEQAAKYVKGNETWLKQLDCKIPKDPEEKEQYLLDLNDAIRKGSESIVGKKPGGDDYERVLAERFRFLSLLGWTKDDHPLSEALTAFSLRYQNLTRPDTMIEMLNLLTAYQAPTMRIVRGYFTIFRRSTQAIEARLQLIKQKGLSIPQVLDNNPRRLLEWSLPTLEKELENLPSESH